MGAAPPLEPDPEPEVELDPPPAATPPLEFEPCLCLEPPAPFDAADVAAVELDVVVALATVELPAEACDVLDELDDDPQPARPAIAQHMTTARSVLIKVNHYLGCV